MALFSGIRSATRTYEPLVPPKKDSNLNQKSFDCTAREYIDKYNSLAKKNGIKAHIDLNSKIIASWSPQIENYSIPNDYVEEFASERLFNILFEKDKIINKIIVIDMSFVIGYSSWKHMQELNKKVALEGMAISLMAVDSSITYDQAKEIVEKSQSWRVKNGKAIINNGIKFVGSPMKENHEILITIPN